MSILTFHNLKQSFADVDIFTGLTASIPQNAKIGLVGPNGIGKTTLLRILAGENQPSGGEVHLAKGTRVGYSQQEAMRAFTNPTNTIYQEMLAVFAGLKEQEEQLRLMETRMGNGDVSASLLEEYGIAQEAFELAGGYDYELRIQQILDGLGLSQAHWQMPLSHCSGGQKTRALLARLLLEEPDLLILDEPTNHLDVAAIEWLENRLQTWKGSLLVVSHDRYFLDKVINNVWEMSINGIETYRGNYTTYLGQRKERWDRYDEEFTAVKERFLKELDFIKRNIARASSTNRAKGQLRRLIRHVKAVEQGGLSALNQSWLQFSEEEGGITGEKWNVADAERHIKGLQSANPGQATIKMRLQPSYRSGRIVLRTKDLQIGYPGKLLFNTNNIELFRQECVAFIGPNGTGKTTFLRTVTGDIPTLNGRIHLGASLKISYFAQTQEKFKPDNSVLDELLAQRSMPVSQARNYLARYLFQGDDVFKLVSSLSGGERGRLALAILSLDNANFLLLDEPTNHLDIPAQEVLQEALQHFDGTKLLVTHDRYLVDKLATQIWELQDGRLHIHKGDYQSFLAARERAKLQAKPAQTSQPAKVMAKDETIVKQQAQKLKHTETLIEKMETVLDKLGQELESATKAQQWDRLQALTREYQMTQNQLESLVAQWGATGSNQDQNPLLRV